MKSLLFASPEYLQLRREIDLIKELTSQNIVVSEEGLIRVTHRVVLGILDRINKHALDILNSVLSLLNVKGVFDKLIYNSPLEDYDKLHGFKLMAAFKANLPAYQAVTVFKPRGMSGSYDEVLSIDHQIFETLNMEIMVKVIDNMIHRLDSILSNTKSTQEDFTKLVADAMNALNPFEGIEDLSTKHDSYFKADPKKDITTTIMKEFGNVHTMDKYIEEAKKQFKFIIKASSIRDIIKEQSSITRKIVTGLEKRSDIISTEALKGLINFLDVISAAYQLYGSVCLTHIALETNLVQVLGSILSIYNNHLAG